MRTHASRTPIGRSIALQMVSSISPIPSPVKSSGSGPVIMTLKHQATISSIPSPAIANGSPNRMHISVLQDLNPILSPPHNLNLLPPLPPPTLFPILPNLHRTPTFPLSDNLPNHTLPVIAKSKPPNLWVSPLTRS